VITNVVGRSTEQRMFILLKGLLLRLHVLLYAFDWMKCYLRLASIQMIIPIQMKYKRIRTRTKTKRGTGIVTAIAIGTGKETEAGIEIIGITETIEITENVIGTEHKTGIETETEIIVILTAIGTGIIETRGKTGAETAIGTGIIETRRETGINAGTGSAIRKRIGSGRKKQKKETKTATRKRTGSVKTATEIGTATRIEIDAIEMTMIGSAIEEVTMTRIETQSGADARETRSKIFEFAVSLVCML